MSRRPKRWKALVWVAAAILAVLLLVGFWVIDNVLPYSLLRPGRSERWNVYHACTPADCGLLADDLWIEPEPGIWLHGWHVRTQAPLRGTILLMHGSSSCKEAMLGLAKLYSENGFNCLLYDSRAHGESGGRYCTFGYYEKRDVSRVLDEAGKRFGPLGPVAIYGTSLGGAVTLQALDVEPRIRAGVVESPFASLREIVRDYMQHYSGVPFSFISNRALACAETIAHFKVDEVSPEAAAGRIRQPVFLAHGTSDHWIAFQYGERISHRLHSPGSSWHPITGADHGDVWRIGGDDYRKGVLDFLDSLFPAAN